VGEGKKHEYVSYYFNLFPIWLGYRNKKSRIKVSYIYSISQKKTVGETIEYYKGKGKEIKFTYVFQINKMCTFSLNWGGVAHIGKQKDSDYKVNLSLIGISIFVGYNFEPKEGGK